MREYPRKLRINTQLHRELAELIATELTDPRLDGVSITQVDVSPDLRNATILVSCLKPDEALAEAVSALGRAGPLLRKGVGRRLRLRYIPQLHFRADTQLRQADRLSLLINQAIGSDKSHARERGEG